MWILSSVVENTMLRMRAVYEYRMSLR